MTNRNMLSTIACKTCHTACSRSVVDSRLLSTLQLPTWSCHLPPTSPTKHSYNCSQLVYNPFRFQLWTRHQQYWYHITSEHLKTGNHYNIHTAPTHWPMRYPANKSLNETILLHFMWLLNIHIDNNSPSFIWQQFTTGRHRRTHDTVGGLSTLPTSCTISDKSSSSCRISRTCTVTSTTVTQPRP